MGSEDFQWKDTVGHWLWFALSQGRRQSAPCTPPSSSLLCSWPVTSLAAPRRLPSAPDHRALCSSGPPGGTEAETERRLLPGPDQHPPWRLQGSQEPRSGA